MSDDAAGGLGVQLAPYVEVLVRFAEAAAVGLAEVGTRYRETFGAYARAVNNVRCERIRIPNILRKDKTVIDAQTGKTLIRSAEVFRRYAMTPAGVIQMLAESENDFYGDEIEGISTEIIDGLIESSSSGNLVNDVIAAACHEATRAIQGVNGEEQAPPWAEAEESQRESSRKAVAAALPGITPEELHRAWCEQREAEGWTYGEEKNAERRTTPYLVPYTELDVMQRAKDAVILGIVAAMSDYVGAGGDDDSDRN